MEKIFRFINTLLLAGILVVLIFVLKKMPPSVNDLIKVRNNEEALEKLSYRIPLVKTYGTASVWVDNEVDVNVTNTPLEIEQW